MSCDRSWRISWFTSSTYHSKSNSRGCLMLALAAFISQQPYGLKSETHVIINVQFLVWYSWNWQISFNRRRSVVCFKQCSRPRLPYTYQWSQIIVRRAYKRKALGTHPDKLGPAADEAEKEVAEAQFRKVCGNLALVVSALRRLLSGVWSVRSIRWCREASSTSLILL